MNSVLSDSRRWGSPDLKAPFSSRATSRAVPISSTDQSAVDMKSLPFSSARPTYPPSLEICHALPQHRCARATPRREFLLVDKDVLVVAYDPSARHHHIAHRCGREAEYEVSRELVGVDGGGGGILHHHQVGRR